MALDLNREVAVNHPLSRQAGNSPAAATDLTIYSGVHFDF
jgi:hypothetical protein